MILGTTIRLRPVNRDDLPRFVAWFADPEVRANLAMYLPFSLAQEEQWFERNLTRGDLQALAIDARSTDGHWSHIGSCGFHEIDWRIRCGEVGIVIGDKQHWGQGYGTDAMRTLVNWGFATLNLNRVQLQVYARNLRAIRVYEKVGFQLEGRLRQATYYNSVYDDVLYMGILREAWTAE